jgi:hypothetical protein
MPKTKRRTQRAQKARSTKTQRRGVAGQIDRVVELQRRMVKRYAALGSNTAKKIVGGDYNTSHWVTDYAAFWDECARDLSDTGKALLGDESLRAGARARQRTAGDELRSWLALQQSLLSRVAGYYREAGQLVAKGSMEPREWFDGGANFWADVVGDVGDWVRREGGEQLRPTAEWMARVHQQVRHGKLTAAVPIEVPMEAFPGQDGGDPGVHLVLINEFEEGLRRVGAGDGVLLEYARYLKFSNQPVKRSQPRCELKLFDLPASLRPGDVYAGVVWAKETKRPIAAVEIEIV